MFIIFYDLLLQNRNILFQETDYASNYFDNGENYLDEDDDNPDENYEYWILIVWSCEKPVQKNVILFLQNIYLFL